jgi:hypothetical protein
MSLGISTGMFKSGTEHGNSFMREMKVSLVSAGYVELVSLDFFLE